MTRTPRDNAPAESSRAAEPQVNVGDVAYLRVTKVNDIGAFLNWGRPKDLLLPFGEQRFRPDEGKRVLVIGCAISGVEIAEDCAQAGVEVMVSSRKGKVRMLPPTFLGRHFLDWWVWAERLPRWVFGPVCARGLRSPGIDLGYRDFRRRRLIAEVGGVERFENFTAVLADGQKETVDAIVCATGYRHEVPFLPEEVAREAGGHPAARHNESVNWPGLFFMGFPCARGVDSQYLRGMARDAPRLARRIRDRLS